MNKTILIVFFCTIFALIGHSQSDPSHSTKLALLSGNAKELSKQFNSTIELNIDGNKKNCALQQAETLVKDFFKSYPPVDFQYLHKGSSTEGFKYVIGKYTYGEGTFRVYVLYKSIANKMKIHTINFSRE